MSTTASGVIVLSRLSADTSVSTAISLVLPVAGLLPAEVHGVKYLALVLPVPRPLLLSDRVECRDTWLCRHWLVAVMGVWFCADIATALSIRDTEGLRCVLVGSETCVDGVTSCKDYEQRFDAMVCKY